MATIYAVFPGTIPEFQQIEKLLADQYTIELVDKVETLSEFNEETGVVLLGGDPDRINSMVSHARTVAPRLGCVIAVGKEQLSQLDNTTLGQADVLVVPADPKEIQTRINMANHMSELRKIIEISAQIDEVTKLYNPRYFIKRLDEEMSLAKRHLSPVSCVLISIYYYDVYMDSYGYQHVASFMEQVAKEVMEMVRTEDVVARLGDSEIAFLLPRSTEKGAYSLTKRILTKLESVPIYMGDQIEHLFLKAGIAAYPAPDESEMDPDTLVRYAKHALHHARCLENKKVQLFSEMRPYV